MGKCARARNYYCITVVRMYWSPMWEYTLPQKQLQHTNLYMDGSSFNLHKYNVLRVTTIKMLGRVCVCKFRYVRFLCFVYFFFS